MEMSGALNLWAFFLRQGHLNPPIIIGPPIYKVNKNLQIGKENAKKVVPLQTKKCIECLVNLFKNKNDEQQG